MKINKVPQMSRLLFLVLSNEMLETNCKLLCTSFVPHCALILSEGNLIVTSFLEVFIFEYTYKD